MVAYSNLPFLGKQTTEISLSIPLILYVNATAFFSGQNWHSNHMRASVSLLSSTCNSPFWYYSKLNDPLQWNSSLAYCNTTSPSYVAAVFHWTPHSGLMPSLLQYGLQKKNKTNTLYHLTAADVIQIHSCINLPTADVQATARLNHLICDWAEIMVTWKMS